VSKGGTEATFCVNRGKKVTRGRRQLINDELHNFYSSTVMRDINQREGVARDV
jgi:hypothetical protein